MTMQERWNEITELLRQARDCISPQHSGDTRLSVPIGLLTGTLDEFEEFLDQNELELAWDALASVAERTGASAGCWHKLAQAANLMQLTDKEAAAAQHAKRPISCDQALAIARQDAETHYGDLSSFKITLILEKGRWYIDFDLRDMGVRGGGPHYEIDAAAGTVLSKSYEQ
jgi:uncharacterized membrane protein YkoI